MGELMERATPGGAHAAPGGPRTTLRYEGWHVEVACADRSLLRWLVAFLSAGFEPAPPGCAADARVSLSIDPAACDRLERRAEGAGGVCGLVDGFSGDGNTVTFERLSGPGPGRLYRDPRMRLLYHVSDDARRVEIRARAADPKLPRAVMRVVRELAMGRAVAEGAVLLHGAAVARGGGAIAICGPRRAGKTSLLCALLRTGGLRYVANDRCFLHMERDGLRLRGLPTLVSIRTPQGERRPALDPPAFCEAMGVSACAGGRLEALVFPRITGAREPLAVRRLAPEEALPRLRAGLFRVDRERLLGGVFTSSSEPSHHRSALALAAPVERALCETVPGFECLLGGGAPPGPGPARRLLARLDASPASPGPPGAA